LDAFSGSKVQIEIAIDFVRVHVLHPAHLVAVREAALERQLTKMCSVPVAMKMVKDIGLWLETVRGADLRAQRALPAGVSQVSEVYG
jgi:hypothetical protein